MKKNIGTQDRLWRLGIAFILLFASWWWHSWILLAASLFVFFEVTFSWCVWYQITGKNTCPLNQNKK